jgi:hypothetical protein
MSRSGEIEGDEAELAEVDERVLVRILDQYIPDS